MISIERLSKRIITHLLADQKDMDIIQRAKIEYGICLLLGLTIELLCAILLSLIFKTTFYLIVIMLTALSLRVCTGGQHCTSYSRCLIFTLICFLSSASLAKYIHFYYEETSIFVLSSILLLSNSLILLKVKKLLTGIKILIAHGVILYVLSNFLAESILVGVGLSVAFGLTIQTCLLTSSGGCFVLFSDKVMKNIGI